MTSSTIRKEEEIVTINEKLDCLDKKIEKQVVSLEKLNNVVNDMRVEMAKSLALTTRIDKLDDTIEKTTINVFNLSNRVTEHAESLKRLDRFEATFAQHQTSDIDTIKELESIIATMKEKEKSFDNKNVGIEKLEYRLSKVEKYIYYGVGAIGTLGSLTVFKIIFDITSYLYKHN
jgi:uncharacterized coiled-coil protein SlyX